MVAGDSDFSSETLCWGKEMDSESGREAEQQATYTIRGTTMPRHIAAILDNLLAMLVSVLAAKQLPDSQYYGQIATLVLTYLAYYFVFEAIICSTPGKFLNGLVVRDVSGRRCSWRQTLLRTLFRLVEVNPFLLGGLPAAARIILSSHKQRFGDLIAGTVVVFR